MSEVATHIFNKLFEKAEWFECKGVLHIGSTTGTPGHWTAHPLCHKRLAKWIGFNEIQYAKSDQVCEVCVLIYLATQVGKSSSVCRNRKDLKE